MIVDILRGLLILLAISLGVVILMACSVASRHDRESERLDEMLESRDDG